VDASQALNSSPHHYLHAKALYFEAIGHKMQHGSVAAPIPARQDGDFTHPMWKLLCLSAGRWLVAPRQKWAFSSCLIFTNFHERHWRSSFRVRRRNISPKGINTKYYWFGIASEREPEIIIDLSLTKADSVQELTNSDSWSVQIKRAVEGSGSRRAPTTVYEGQRLILHFSTTPRTIRSLELYRNGGFVARVLVHHPAIVKKQSSSSTQRQVRDAIGGLDSGSADLSSLIATISKVIFSESTEKLLRGTDGQGHSRAHKNGR